MIVWFLGLSIGSVMTYLVTWYFYRRGKTDTSAMEERLQQHVEEIVLQADSLTSGKASQEPESVAKKQSKAGSDEVIISAPSDRPGVIKGKILQQLVDGKIYVPELHMLARIFSEVGKDISEISSLYGEIGHAAVHGMDTSDKMDQLQKRIQEMLEKK